MIKLSYIISVYNGAKTIAACLDRILSLPIAEDEYEILVTDDYSTDNTVAILEEYARQHPSIKVMRQDRNHRQGAARNRGLKVAKGMYITFVDADDSVEPDIVKALDTAVTQQVDIFCAKSLRCTCPDTPDEETCVVKIISELPVDKIYTGQQFCQAVRNFCGDNGTPWGYLFRRNYVQSIGRIFIEDHLFEETDWIASYFYKAATIYYSDLIIYKYYINPASIMAGNMSFQYVTDSTRLACRMMMLADEFRHESNSLAEDWYEYADKGLLNKGLRWNFLVRYPYSEFSQFHHLIGTECLTYLKSHYRGDFFKTMFLHHRHITLFALALIRPLHILQWKIRRRGPMKRNFYQR